MSRLVTGARRTPALTDAQFDAEALAIIRPSWADRDRYADPAAQVAALRALADRRARERWPLVQVTAGHNNTSGLFPPPSFADRRAGR